MRIVIIGAMGVVGSALAKYFDVFSHNVVLNDVMNGPNIETNLASCLGREDMIFVCVPTPSKDDGGINLDIVEQVTRDIGRIARIKKYDPSVVYKSTMIPGSTARMEEILITYGLKPKVAYSPEFIRQRCAFADMLAPSRIVVGSPDEEFADHVMGCFSGTEVPKIMFDSYEAAELVKYYANCYYAARISFFNQMKQFADKLGCDHNAIIRAVVEDKTVGVHGSDPTGVPWGGNCLLKDQSAMIKYGEELGVYTRVLKSIQDMNNLMIHKNKFKSSDLTRWA